jgi:hypothetical protein
MGLWDMIVTFSIIAAAAYYIWRKFAGSGKGGGCGCSSETGCCGGSSGSSSSTCGGVHHKE